MESVLANEGWQTGGLTSSFIGGGDSFFVTVVNWRILQINEWRINQSGPLQL